MAGRWWIDVAWDSLDIGLTLEDVMRDLDPGWDAQAGTAPAEAADVAALLAVLA